MPVPNTEVAVRSYSITYFDPSSDGRGAPSTATRVAPKDLRVVGDAKGGWEPPADLKPSGKPAVDESTGIGRWQTVAVRTVDPAVKAAELARARELDALRSAQSRQERDRLVEETAETDDAMGSYDPWGTGKYRGIDLSRDAAADAADDDDAPPDGATVAVAFKKRKTDGAAKKKVMRKKLDD